MPQQQPQQRLRAAVLAAAELVSSDATRYSSQPGTPQSPTKPGSSSGGGSSNGGSSCAQVAEALSGEAYLRVRGAFAEAFEELLAQQGPAPDQVHELWACMQDYLDRTVARADIALGAAEQLRAEKEQVCREHAAAACQGLFRMPRALHHAGH